MNNMHLIFNIKGIEGSANKLGVGIVTDAKDVNDLILANPRVTYITPSGNSLFLNSPSSI